MYLYIHIHTCVATPHAPIFSHLYGHNTAFLQETVFHCEEEKPQRLSNFRDLTFPISNFPTFLDLTFQLPYFPTFNFPTFFGLTSQLPNIPNFQHSKLPTFQVSNFQLLLGLTFQLKARLTKVGSFTVRSNKVGKLGPARLKRWKVMPNKVEK